MATVLCSGGQLHHSHKILKKQSVFHENSLHNNRLPLHLTYKIQLFLFFWVLSPTLVLKTKQPNAEFTTDTTEIQHSVAKYRS